MPKGVYKRRPKVSRADSEIDAVVKAWGRADAEKAKAKAPRPEWYCVINDKAPQGAERSWFSEASHAVAHAREIVEANREQGKLTDQLLVVRVVKRVTPDLRVEVTDA